MRVEEVNKELGEEVTKTILVRTEVPKRSTTILAQKIVMDD